MSSVIFLAASGSRKEASQYENYMVGSCSLKYLDTLSEVRPVGQRNQGEGSIALRQYKMSSPPEYAPDSQNEVYEAR
ncbi:uncharacterized protein [Rutidosis leptorrhynchoides]|uniref:uncharacterized protein isoform X2 n=1 Tax=Rutidosis leptorrhynchoides TaxID=125765 RepID=UPI003A9933C6